MQPKAFSVSLLLVCKVPQFILPQLSALGAYKQTEAVKFKLCGASDATAAKCAGGSDLFIGSKKLTIL